MRKENLENMTLTGHLEGKRGRGKQCMAYLTSLCKCLAEQELGDIAKRPILLRVTGNCGKPQSPTS